MIFCENMADALGKKIPCSQFQVQVTPQAGTMSGGEGTMPRSTQEVEKPLESPQIVPNLIEVLETRNNKK